MQPPVRTIQALTLISYRFLCVIGSRASMPGCERGGLLRSGDVAGFDPFTALCIMSELFFEPLPRFARAEDFLRPCPLERLPRATLWRRLTV